MEKMWNGWRKSAMSNTARIERAAFRWPALALGLGMWAACSMGHLSAKAQEPSGAAANAAATAATHLPDRQQAIVPIAAFAAAGDLARLNTALNHGLDAGLTVNDAKEILVQV